MNRETLIPADEAAWLEMRKQDLTSTDVAALFGLSPYKTEFELWHEKREGEGGSFSDNDRMLWGRRLQDAIAVGIADDLGLIVRPMLEYMRIPGSRLGSSFDWSIEGVRDDSPFADRFATNGPGILEIKNVDWLAFRKGWVVEDDFVEAPAHIEIQTQHQQLVAGRSWSIIGALVGGNRYEVLERLADEAVHNGIIRKAAEFWQSIADCRAPDPVMPDDAEAVIRMNQMIDPGKLYDGRGDAEIASLLLEYKRLGDQEKVAGEQRKVIKAELLQKIGTAESALTDVGKISAGVVGPAEIAYTRAGYRSFRFTPAKVKAAA